jgi:hypothetical protein
MLALSPSFKTFLGLLNAHHVEYLLVGGLAVRHYGHLRPTDDLDIWISTSAENALRLVEVCKAFSPGMPTLTPEIFQNENRIVTLIIPPIGVLVREPIIGLQPKVLDQLDGDHSDHIELLTLQSGMSFADCFSERVMAEIDGVAVNLISLEHLKAIKQAGNRPKDIDDLQHLS